MQALTYRAEACGESLIILQGGKEIYAEVKPRLISYVDHYNTIRLHSATDFVTPAEMLAGPQADVHAARDRKLEEARQRREKRRQKVA
jgi:hypothetical protein